MIGKLEVADHPILRMNREHGVYNFDIWIHRPEGPVATVSTHNRYDALGEAQGQKQGPNTDFARLGAGLF